MKRLSTRLITKIHDELIAETGGSYGIRDAALLDSAVNAPYHTLDGQYLYPTQQAKAARLCCSIIGNHPFMDGNKRIGIAAMIVFLGINGISLNSEDSELVDLGIGIADGSIDCDTLTKWIIRHN